MEKYLTVENNKLITVDEARYGISESYKYQNIYYKFYSGVTINGVKEKDFKKLENKY